MKYTHEGTKVPWKHQRELSRPYPLLNICIQQGKVRQFALIYIINVWGRWVWEN